MGFTFGDKPCQDPKMIAKALAKDTTYTVMRDWYGQANRYTCPLGATPGRGLILLKKGDLDQLADQAYDLRISDQLRTLQISSLNILKAYCITPGSDDDPNSIYAVEITDGRYFLWQRFTNAAYNVKKAPDKEYVDETTDSGTPYSWDDLGSALWADAGLGSWPGWDVTPDGIPEGWHFWQVPSILAFQAFARRLRRSLRLNPFTGSYGIVALGDDDAAFESSVADLKARHRRWDEKWVEPWSAVVPETVRVVFRRVIAEADGNPYIFKDIAFPDSDLSSFARSGTYAQVWDDLFYTDDNDAALTTRAAERADDFATVVRYFNPNASLHYRVVGTTDDLFLGPRCSQVTWQDVGEGSYTIVESAPLENVDYSRYLQGCGEVMVASECDGGDIVNTFSNVWGGGKSPLRFS